MSIFDDMHQLLVSYQLLYLSYQFLFYDQNYLNSIFLNIFYTNF